MLKSLLLSFLILFILPLSGNSQDMTYAQSVIHSLTSPEMHGRGYVKKGDKIAADYIKDEYIKHGLISFKQGYFQDFEIRVNTFPGTMQVIVDGRMLTPGVDYIVHPAMQTAKGHYDIQVIDEPIKSISDVRRLLERGKFHVIEIDSSLNHKDKRSIIDHFNETVYGPGVIILEPKKLTWSVSSSDLGRPILYVLKSAWKENAKKITLNISSKHIPDYKTQNVVGFLPGKKYKDEFVFVTAHYDHLGRMGKHTYFPGANDNASGVSMLLQLAKYYSRPENQPDYSMVFICFAAEEAGILGSKYFVENSQFPLEKIKFLLNMDLLGTGSKGITVVNGKVYEDAFNAIVELNNEHNYLVKIKSRGKAANSDHYFFTEAGVPAFFFYTMGGISAYHDVYDVAETLPLTEYEDLFKLFTGFINQLN